MRAYMCSCPKGNFYISLFKNKKVRYAIAVSMLYAL